MTSHLIIWQSYLVSNRDWRMCDFTTSCLNSLLHRLSCLSDNEEKLNIQDASSCGILPTMIWRAWHGNTLLNHVMCLQQASLNDISWPSLIHSRMPSNASRSLLVMLPSLTLAWKQSGSFDSVQNTLPTGLRYRFAMPVKWCTNRLSATSWNTRNLRELTWSFWKYLGNWMTSEASSHKSLARA